MRIGTWVRVSLMASAAAGCWVGEAAVREKIGSPTPETSSEVPEPSESSSDLPALTFDGLSPELGSNRGGDEIEIVIGPLIVEDVTVTFGGVPADVISVDVDRVVVETPELAIQGPVDVVVSSAGRSHRERHGYYFWNDGTDHTGLFGFVQNYDVGRAYISPPAARMSAWLLWTAPVQLEGWELYAGALDSCARNYTRLGPSVGRLRPGVDAITLQVVGDKTALVPDENGEYYDLSMTEGAFSTQGAYDIVQAAGGPGWPAMNLSASVQVPEPFQVTSPSMNTHRPILPWKASVPLEWSGGTPGDVVLVRLVRYTTDLSGASVVAERITCALHDDGHHVVDGSLWAGWDPSDYLDIWVGRALELPQQVPFNRSEVKVYGVHWWYGEALQGP